MYIVVRSPFVYNYTCMCKYRNRLTALSRTLAKVKSEKAQQVRDLEQGT